MTGRRTAPVRVMLVEDNAAVRRAVADLLNASGDLQVCAEAATVAEAGAVAETSQPDVVIVDLRLPDGSGVEAGREVRARLPDARLLLLTSAGEEEALLGAVLTGASGFLVKQLLGNDLLGTVRALAGGDTLIDVTDGATAVARARDRLASDGEAGRILGLLADGCTDAQIAVALGLPKVEVRERVASVLARLEGTRRRRPGGTSGLRARARMWAEA